LEQVACGSITLVEGAARMKVSYRQAKRLAARHRQWGALGLVHRSRGRPGARRKPPALRRAVLDLIGERYEGFGPTLAGEKLAEEHQLTVDRETLRRWMTAEGLWKPRGPERKHRRRRPRRARLGELVQMDGSHHAWFEGRGASACLMVMIDDATGIRMARLEAEETTEGAMRLLKSWIERFGVPQALYVDRKSTFVTDRAPTAAERRDGVEPMTVFGRACAKLEIDIIPAHSPQAKGRVERANGVFQDRWVKELRLAGVSTIEEANAMLPAFVDKLNARLAVEAADPIDAHLALGDRDLDSILVWEEPRTVANDMTVRYKKRFYQLEPSPGGPRPKGRVIVRRRLDGSLQILDGDRPVAWRALTEPPSRPPAVGAAKKRRPRRPYKPPPDHPWREPRRIGKTTRRS
jgi:hypothetical protein